MKNYTRSFVLKLEQAIQKHPDFIHVVLGPRQVGKTTGVLQLLERLFTKNQYNYISADGDLQKSPSWILEQFALSEDGKKKILVIDEIQKVENWSENIKKIWDEQKNNKKTEKIRFILLGSSSLDIQKGLSESLAGRYLLHNVPHWDFEESKKAFGLSFDDFIRFGGYPASYAFLDQKLDWDNYIKNSIIAAVLGKDILSLAHVKSPALFRQCFDLACSYSSQEISYTKLLGQLQNKGNTDLVRYYLDLLEGAYLLKQIFKFSDKRALVTKTSSPKIIALCPALYTAARGLDFEKDDLGRAFESYIGSLLNQFPVSLYYWREKNYEVDFVLKSGKSIFAIEVKSGKKKYSGLNRFKQQFPQAELLLITPDNHTDVLGEIRKRISP